jgi:hypothetical protein
MRFSPQRRGDAEKSFFCLCAAGATKNKTLRLRASAVKNKKGLQLQAF